MADTMSEFPAAGPHGSVGRMYICRRCAKEVALLFGFVKGPEMAKLIDASDVVDLKVREGLEKDGLIKEALDKISEKDKIIGSLEEQCEFLENRVKKLELVAKAVRESAKELV